MKIVEGPREKLFKYGAESLSDAELLAILIKTGNKQNNVLELAEQILDDLTSVSCLKDCTCSELMKYEGIGLMKASTIVCSMELSKRIESRPYQSSYIRTPRDLFEFLKDDMKGLTQETLYAVYLATDLHIIAKIKLFQGTIDSVRIDAREIIKRALKLNSTTVCLAHNHPSGSPRPSEEDLKSTKYAEDKLNYFNLVLFDHIIIGEKGYYSIKYGIEHKTE